jgi:hypothetical protein
MSTKEQKEFGCYLCFDFVAGECCNDKSWAAVFIQPFPLKHGCKNFSLCSYPDYPEKQQPAPEIKLLNQ